MHRKADSTKGMKTHGRPIINRPQNAIMPYLGPHIEGKHQVECAGFGRNFNQSESRSSPRCSHDIDPVNLRYGTVSRHILEISTIPTPLFRFN